LPQGFENTKSNGSADDGCADSGSDNTKSNGSADDRFADSGSDNTNSNGSADDRCADSGSDNTQSNGSAHDGCADNGDDAVFDARPDFSRTRVCVQCVCANVSFDQYHVADDSDSNNTSSDSS
jgi:hypothetical protein